MSSARSFDVRERGRDTRVETADSLRDDVHSGRQPRTRPTVEHDDVARRRSRPHRAQRVRERRFGEIGRFDRSARWAQPSLDPTRPWFLGDDDPCEIGGHTRAATTDMSRSARTVPETLPLTFDRPLVRAR